MLHNTMLYRYKSKIGILRHSTNSFQKIVEIRSYFIRKCDPTFMALLLHLFMHVVVDDKHALLVLEQG
mgnify:CR=1 FL=1